MPRDACRVIREAAAALRNHWPEYALEACELALFMASACLFGVILEHPDSPARQALVSPLARRAVMGLAMGLTAIALIFSPLGQRSGAHMNPAVTLTYWRLGRIAPWDGVFYIAAQVSGAMLGVQAMHLVLGERLGHVAVNHVATVPGRWGIAAAWLGEFLIALVMMSVVLLVSNRASLARYTGLCAGALVAIYITIEAPISGMSMNPARTLGSALAAGSWTGLWIYLTAPPAAMLLASVLYERLFGLHRVHCAKLHHFNGHRCIFRCRFAELTKPGTPPRGITLTAARNIPPPPDEVSRGGERLYCG
jgi:aquaporin Z